MNNLENMAEAEEELQGEDAGSTKKEMKRSRRKKENRREEEPQVLEEEKHRCLLKSFFKMLYTYFSRALFILY